MIETERLVLRGWREEDRDAYAAINADPIVMEHFPDVFTREQSDDAVDRNNAMLAEYGWGNWALERRADRRLLGHVGLKPTGAALPFDGRHEISWRLANFAWGQGYASEAAHAVLSYGFVELGLIEILAMTSLPNLRSQAVMRRIGMVREPERDFDHPALPKGDRLERHLLYAARPS